MPKRVFEPKEKEQLKLTMLEKEEYLAELIAYHRGKMIPVLISLVFRKG